MVLILGDLAPPVFWGGAKKGFSLIWMQYLYFLSNFDGFFSCIPHESQHNRPQASWPISLTVIEILGVKNGHAVIFKTSLFLIGFWWGFLQMIPYEKCNKSYSKHFWKICNFLYKRGQRVLKMRFCRRCQIFIFHLILMEFFAKDFS